MPNGTSSALSEALAARKTVLTTSSDLAVRSERRNANPSTSSSPIPGPSSPRSRRDIIANLENGRGNPTTDALTRLARALGTRLTIGFADTADPPAPPPAELPAALVRLGRTTRSRSDVRTLNEATGQDATELAGRLLNALARLSALTGRDLTEPDWLRLLDALLLVAVHPDPGEQGFQ